MNQKSGRHGSVDDLEDFFENGALGLHIVAGDGTILRANKAELAMLGYSADEYIGRHIAEFHADAPAISDILARLGRGERLDRYPARLRAKDGSIRHVLITSSGLFRDGQFIHTRCFTLDVTEAKAAEERLLEGEQRFQAALEALPMAIYTTDAQGKVTFYNRAAAQLAGREPAIGVDEWCVTWRLNNPDGSHLPLDQCPMAIALKEQRPVRGAELIAERPDGSRARLVPYPTPLFDNDGRLTGAINMLVDITERYASEQDSARLAAIVRSSQDAFVSITTEGQITYWSPGAERTYGFSGAEMVGQPITRIIPPELHEEELHILDRVRQGELIEHYETERLTKDGRRIAISLTVSLARDKSGNVTGVAKVARDISERKQAERLKNLLLGELNHRVKNTLAIVQAIAHQTVHTAKSPSEFANSFSGRLRALSHAHSLLTDNAWQGTDLMELVRDQLLLGGEEDERISYSGPSVTLDPQAALHLALVLHELGTNARKHGSLSVPKGRLSIHWTVRTSGNRKLLFHWKEHGGPRVVAPSNRGFGTTLVEQSLRAHEGEVTVDFEAGGVTCEIKLPLKEPGTSLVDASNLRKMGLASAADSGAVTRGIGGKRILIVDDEPLVAMDVVAILEEEGCEVVGPAATFEKAKNLIETSSFDIALLDANLGGHKVDELAAALTRLKIPFAFLTGYGREGLPEAFRHLPLISKPYGRKQLVASLERLVERPGSVVPFRQHVS